MTFPNITSLFLCYLSVPLSITRIHLAMKRVWQAREIKQDPLNSIHTAISFSIPKERYTIRASAKPASRTTSFVLHAPKNSLRVFKALSRTSCIYIDIHECTYTCARARAGIHILPAADVYIYINIYDCVRRRFEISSHLMLWVRCFRRERFWRFRFVAY